MTAPNLECRGALFFITEREELKMGKSKRELDAAEFERQAKELRRAEKAFWAEVEERREEVASRIRVSDRFEEICQTYGADTEEQKAKLYQHIVSDRQVSYYRANIAHD